MQSLTATQACLVFSKPALFGALLGLLVVLTWLLTRPTPDVVWNITAMAWAIDSFVLSAMKVLHQ
jgi:hypothetical protein